MSILEKINSPQDLKSLSIDELGVLCQEIRSFLIELVSRTGGHLAASLGTVELTVALHYVLNSPDDKIVWDVGHQSYTHKLLTGRRESMQNLRQPGGISGFPNRKESPYDVFTVGHASTAISQALGLAVARDYLGKKNRVVAVIGDGSLTGGLSYEALNNAGHLRRPFLIVLNDNEMAISRSVGAMSRYLNRIITNPLYNRFRNEVENSLRSFPRIRKLARQTLESVKHFLVPGIIFEELGIRYFGPVDGHDIRALIETIKKIIDFAQPCILHVLTKKGKGYEPAEKHPEKFHGIQPRDLANQEKLQGMENGIDKKEGESTYTEAFSRAVVRLAEEDSRLITVSAAMPEGAGLTEFQKRFPDRFFDVGIAEEHAVTFAGALAVQGLKPVCAIYSTFLQRSYDQLLHDVALQDAGVVFCVDHAGLVGSDGPTHHGVFDIAYLSSIPRSVIAQPRDGNELFQMLKLGIGYNGVFAIRYPKGVIPKSSFSSPLFFQIGEAEVARKGKEVAILAVGDFVKLALEVADLLDKEGFDATVCNLRFIKPLDRSLILNLAKDHKFFYTLEEHVFEGGMGERVLSLLNEEKVENVHLKRFALPNDFIEQGSRSFLLDKYGFTPYKLAAAIKGDIKRCKK
ncbi:MAG: 1-deoxy-D-xylulose-5-phosphate synthase [Candidatus Omnitrophica bacterium]|nr:1-deoxy-D-xylulose-5-phosphate synthase [Candidatus Omnitrophota bacterium]